MPGLPELTVVCEVLNRSILGQTILTAESIPPGGPIVVRDLTAWVLATYWPARGSKASRGGASSWFSHSRRWTMDE